MKKLILAGMVAITVAATSVWAQTLTIAQWTFETSQPATAGPFNPETGIGQALGHHAGAATYSSPSGDLDPVIALMNSPSTLPANVSPSSHSYSANVWVVGDYWEFDVSTLSDTGVEIGWDQAGSNTGPGNFALYYSVNGGAYAEVGSSYTVPLSAWNSVSTQALSKVVSEPGSAWDNAATLSFHLVDMSTTSVNGGTVASGGTDRVDNFTVIAIPEPSTVLLVCAGLAGGLLAMRRRS